ncbi:MAG: transcription elongation factor GreA, partial [Desulfurivibrionaceae bacterium]
MSQEGYARLRQELDRLQKKERPAV